MRIVFWQNMMSFHQSAHIRALAATLGCEVTWVVQEAVLPERAALWWPVPDAGPAQVVVDPDYATVDELVSDRPERSVHIFSGLRGYRTIELGLAACLAATPTLGFLVERQDGAGWKGLARLLRARLDWRALRERISFVLAIGAGASEWYVHCGVPSERIYPYGYFMEAPDVALAPRRAVGPALGVVYVGALRHAKGVDILLAALAHLRYASWTLDVVGDGPEAPALRRLAAAKGLSQRVRFHGTLPHGRAMATLAESDLLVLPSRHKDGWGAVVSEALMRGVPAVCTDQCGAGALLGDPQRGEIVSAGSVPALEAALQRRIQQGPPSLVERRRVVDWSQCITGESGAKYLLTAVRHALGQGPRPVAPWLHRNELAV